MLEMTTRACPLCGSTDTSQVFAEAAFDPAKWDKFAFASRKMPEYMHYRLIACPQCDLLYANPLPTLEALAEAYQEAAFDSAEEASGASLTYARFLPEIKRSLPDTQGALDIGTGDGAFLEQLLQAGFTEVAGVEPSLAPIAGAKDAIRPLIRPGLFQATDYAPGQFSLITCFQTLEHLYDPLEMCRESFGLLKPGGAVFFIGHNRRAWSARLLQFKSPIFDIEHLQLFSPRSLRALLEMSGFQNVRVVNVVNRYPLHYYVKLFPLPEAAKKRLLPRLRKSRLGNWLIPMPLGNLAVIGYKPR
jgi:SAM-dependent methyltransferase